MKIENIVKKLAKEEKEVYRWQFDNQEFWFCNGTALVDIADGQAQDTDATYKVVLQQIENDKSHIYTIDNKKKQLNENTKLGH